MTHGVDAAGVERVQASRVDSLLDPPTTEAKIQKLAP